MLRDACRTGANVYALRWTENGEPKTLTYEQYEELIYQVAKSFLKVCNILIFFFR